MPTYIPEILTLLGTEYLKTSYSFSSSPLSENLCRKLELFIEGYPMISLCCSHGISAFLCWIAPLLLYGDL